MQLCDLHVHSIFSDGTCSPKEILSLAKQTGLSAVALTDHNTIECVEEFLEESRNFNVEAVVGVEISSEYNGKSLHVLALFIDQKHFCRVKEFLQILQNRKKESNDLLAKRLVERGYQIDYQKIKNQASGQINRVHFAKELLDLGVVSSIEQACATILSEDGDIYIPPKRFSTLEVIQFIKSINAVSVLAHPLLDLTKEELIEFLPKAKACGLTAIETMYSKYTIEEQSFSAKLTKKFGLLESGGSDFHGKNKPDIKIGIGQGGLLIPYEFAKQMKNNI